MRIKNYKTEYLRYSRVEKENCFSTVAKYRDALKKIILTIGNIEILTINQNTILELKERLLDEKLSDSRRALIISVLKNFLRFLSEFVGLQVYDYSKIIIPKVRAKLVKTMSLEAIEYFIEILPALSLKDRRFKALVCLLSDSGARISEILGLGRDIRPEAKEATVLGKGQKFRQIYWSDRSAHYLQLYQDARPGWDRSKYLFGTVNRSKKYSGKWDKGDVNRAFRKWSKKIGKRIHCHLFRSSFLTNCVHSGISVSAVSRAMGHSDVRTSMRYFSPMSDKDTRQTFHEYFERKATVDARVNIETEKKGGEEK